MINDNIISILYHIFIIFLSYILSYFVILYHFIPINTHYYTPAAHISTMARRHKKQRDPRDPRDPWPGPSRRQKWSCDACSRPWGPWDAKASPIAGCCGDWNILYKKWMKMDDFHGVKWI
jgi:hypothetical protein